MSDQQRCLGFVLSAGRTGTVWMAKTLSQQFPNVRFEHEPPPARRELMLGNLRNEWGIGRNLIRKFFLSVRRKRWDRLEPSEGFVEINPMLCSITDLLLELDIPLKVVHVVRDPRSWCKSIMNFKASGFRKLVIDYTPLATPYPTPRPPDWRRMDMKKKSLWRWRYCNERILEIKPQCDSYALIRHEDLFSSDIESRRSCMQTLLQTFDLASNDEELSWLDVSQRENASPGKSTASQFPDEEDVQEICGELLEKFDYQNTTETG